MEKTTQTSNDAWTQNAHLTVERFRSIEERVASDKPQLQDSLAKLKLLLGPSLFDKHINRLQNISKNEQTLLLVTSSEMRRTLLERECLPALKEAFQVQRVRVVSGSTFAGGNAF